MDTLVASKVLTQLRGYLDTLDLHFKDSCTELFEDFADSYFLNSTQHLSHDNS